MERAYIFGETARKIYPIIAEPALGETVQGGNEL